MNDVGKQEHKEKKAAVILAAGSGRRMNTPVAKQFLDFGISYVNAKQASDRKYITEEIRRKSMQRLVHDVAPEFGYCPNR